MIKKHIFDTAAGTTATTAAILCSMHTNKDILVRGRSDDLRR